MMCCLNVAVSAHARETEHEKKVQSQAGARPLRPLEHGRDQNFILVEQRIIEGLLFF